MDRFAGAVDLRDNPVLMILQRPCVSGQLRPKFAHSEFLANDDPISAFDQCALIE